jgi:predicted RNase H-like HicB family nuclease
MSELAGNSTLSVADSQTPLEIWEVTLDDSTIKFFKPLFILPTVLDADTTEECYFAECPEIGVSAVGVDIDELISCLHSDIRIMWKRIVRKPDNELLPADRTIKRRFLELAWETNDG